MDAGRELDEFVGERVFKLKVERAERWWIEGERDWTDDGELVYMEGVNVRRLPAYSTDIAAAWPVVDELRERGWHMELDNRGTDWSVLFLQYKEPMPDCPWQLVTDEVAASAPTAPRAICLAALKVVGA